MTPRRIYNNDPFVKTETQLWALVECRQCNSKFILEGNNEYIIGMEFAKKHFGVFHPHKYKQLREEMSRLIKSTNSGLFVIKSSADEAVKIQEQGFKIIMISGREGMETRFGKNIKII